MAGNKILNVEPQYVASAAGNLLNPNVTAVTGPVGFTMTQPYHVIKHVRITNKDSADFITGSADASQKVTITFDCEIGVS